MKKFMNFIATMIFCCIAIPAFCNGAEIADEPAYVDRVTGHLYVKVDVGTYNEFTKKGEFFRTVPADQPHLNNRKYVQPSEMENLVLAETGVSGPQSQMKPVKKAEQAIYEDRITGHRYVRMDVNNYMEFNKKGEFFKLVSADQPHLNNRRYVLPMNGVEVMISLR